MMQHKMCPQEFRQVLRPCISDFIVSKVELLQLGEGRQCLDQVFHLLVGPSTVAEPWCLSRVSRAPSCHLFAHLGRQHSVGLSVVVCIQLLTSSILVGMCVTCGQTRVLAAASKHHDSWLLDAAASSHVLRSALRRCVRCLSAHVVLRCVWTAPLFTTF